jgi:hypothetical protein
VNYPYFFACSSYSGARSTRDASKRKSRRFGIFMTEVTIPRNRGETPLECDSIPERKIDQLPVILYVSLTKKFVGLRDDKDAQQVVRGENGLRVTLHL